MTYAAAATSASNAGRSLLFNNVLAMPSFHGSPPSTSSSSSSASSTLGGQLAAHAPPSRALAEQRRGRCSPVGAVPKPPELLELRQPLSAATAVVVIFHVSVVVVRLVLFAVQCGAVPAQSNSFEPCSTTLDRIRHSGNPRPQHRQQQQQHQQLVSCTRKLQQWSQQPPQPPPLPPSSGRSSSRGIAVCQ